MLGLGIVLLRLLALALVIALVAVDSAAAAATDSRAPVVTGSVTLTSESGEPLAEGRSLSFPARAIGLGTDESGSVVLRLNGYGGWWINLSAPDGAQLQPGVYDDAQRFADALMPGLSVSGGASGCDPVRGEFEVLDVEYGPYDYLETLEATFEHHCGDSQAALRGTIDVSAAPPPPALEIEVTFDEHRVERNREAGTVSLRGTVECSDSAGALVDAWVGQTHDAGTASGAEGVSVMCSPRPTSWFVEVRSFNGVPYTSGDLDVTVEGQAVDEWYSDYTGDQILATDAIPEVDEDASEDDVEVEVVSTSEPGFVSREPLWSIAIALAILGAVAWGLVVAGWVRGRQSGPRPS